MKLRKEILLAAVLVAMPALGQVEKVAVRTTGISCGDCAAVSEIYLRRLEGVDKVAISMSKEAVLVTYKPGASFQPWDIRDALSRTDVGVVQIQISARGRVQEQAGKRFFVAGKDKFLLLASPPTPNAPPTPKVPSDTPVTIEGIVNDRTDPMELRVLSFQPLK